MRKILIVTALMMLLCVSVLHGDEIKGSTMIGLRGPVFLPFWNGSQFNFNNTNYQPFLRGWDFTLEGKKAFTDHFVLGGTLGYVTTYDDTSSLNDRGDVASKSDNAYAKLTGILIGIDGEYYYEPSYIFQPYLLAGIGVDIWKVKRRIDNESHGSTDLAVKIGTGLLVPITKKFAIDLQAKFTFEKLNVSTSIPEGFYGTGDWSKYSKRPFRGYFEPSIGLIYSFGGEKDSDKDGVSDSKDACPGTPLGAKVDKTGCPLDEDGDGVYDGIDQCPDTPAGAIVDARGCPIDSDKDGVYDGLDKCPDTPAGVAVDKDGCPPDTDGDGVPDYRDKEPNTVRGAKVDKDGVAIDSDKDGVPDGLDACPDTPAGAQVDKRGCPYDADQDGVPDSVDQCLGTPIGIKVDSTGCPFVKKITEKITLHINYASNSFEPDAVSKHELDSIAIRIMSYGDTKIEIRGFTDDRNTDEHNLTLSQKRAEGVMEYLKSKGVPPERMTAKGFGEDPKYFVADNKTAEGRRLNRRVEIESVK